jgi:hypothetical protein
MIARRRALLLLGVSGAIAAAACMSPRDRLAAPAAPRVSPLHLDPMVDLVPAAGLTWLVQARPSELWAHPAISRAIATLVAEERFAAFAQRHGGVDVRQASELVVAGYPDATLGLAAITVDPARVEVAFAARALEVEGRAESPNVLRLWGKVGSGREQIAVFGRQGVAIERGRFEPLRAAVYFAEGRLKRSLPALRAEPLAAAAQRLGEAPLRGFAPGPFEGGWAAGVAGLLGATMAAAAGLFLVPSSVGDAVMLRVVLMGAWGADGPAAAERLAASFRLLADDSLGRLIGLDHATAEGAARARGDATALQLDVSLDPLALARGLRAATDASVAQIMDF